MNLIQPAFTSFNPTFLNIFFIQSSLSCKPI
jgi:hypothetical protein